MNAARRVLQPGAKLLPVAGPGAKLTPSAVLRGLDRRDDVHSSKPRAISISQTTEWACLPARRGRGTRRGRERARARLHMDGALCECAGGCWRPRGDLTWRRVDVLSLGGTKCGLNTTEAVVFFQPQLAASSTTGPSRARNWLPRCASRPAVGGCARIGRLAAACGARQRLGQAAGRIFAERAGLTSAATGRGERRIHRAGSGRGRCHGEGGLHFHRMEKPATGSCAPGHATYGPRSLRARSRVLPRRSALNRQ